MRTEQASDRYMKAYVDKVIKSSEKSVRQEVNQLREDLLQAIKNLNKPTDYVINEEGDSDEDWGKWLHQQSRLPSALYIHSVLRFMTRAKWNT